MKRLALILSVIISSCQVVFGQGEDTSGIRQTFVIKYDLEIEIDSAERPYGYSPDDVKKNNGKVTPQEYNSKEFEAKLKDENPKIRVYKVNPLPQKDLHGFYTKAGYGPLYNTPYLEAIANSKQNKDYQYGAYVHHMSSSRGSVDKKNSGQSVNQLDLYGKRFWKNQTLSSNLGYARNRFNYYGYDQNLGIGERDVRDSIKQAYQNIYAEVALGGVDTSSKVSNKNNLGFYLTSDYYDASEWAVYTKNDFKVRLEEAQILLQVDFYYSPYSNDTVSNDRMFLRANPSYGAKVGKRLAYNVGVNFNYDNDDFADAKNVHLYPMLYGEYLLNKVKRISAYIKFDGEMQRNSFKDLSEENPFLNANLDLRNTNDKFRVELGSKGYVFKGVSYSGFLKYKKVENLALFVNDSLDQSRFNVVYEDKVADQFTAQLGLAYSKNKKYDLGVSVRYDYYNLPTFEYAYHLPAFTGKILGGYRILPKLKAVMEFYYMAGIKAYDYQTSESKSLGSIADLNVGLEYFVNDKWSVFGDFNNILNKDYERYYNYNTKKFNFILGLSYAF